MAYLIKILNSCTRANCDKLAAVKLCDWTNEIRGLYCSRHGNEALKDRQKFEDTHNRDGSSRKESSV